MAGTKGRSGRRPTPTAILKTQGTFRKDRHGNRATEPQPGGYPVKPRGMAKAASRHWDRVVPGLAEIGVATVADGPALQRLCEWWAIFEDLRGNGPDGEPKRVAAMATAFKAWSDLASRFGMTPSDRAALRLPEQPAPQVRRRP